MDKFSQRMGFEPLNEIIQIDSMSKELRNSLWSALFIAYWKNDDDDYMPTHRQDLFKLCNMLWLYYFKYPIDRLNLFWRPVFHELRAYFFKCKWHNVYDFLEHVAEFYSKERNINPFFDTCNLFLKKELSAYRFVNKKMVRITDEQEIKEIEEAISNPDSLKHVSEHLKTSLSLLSDKKSPDFRNSIKESISAVEAICKVISGKDKATLRKALKKIKKSVEIHPALEKSFLSLYDYTSDSNGIRHSLTEESDLDFEDAKFMLVSCSAFINYLKEKAIKAKIKL